MKSNEATNKHLVVVLGMHRCGTSVITRGLQVLGVDLGEDLMPASSGNNDKGFWEDVGFNRLNIELLEVLGHDWHSLAPIRPEEWQHPALEQYRLRAVELLRARFASSDSFGVKDPRMVRTLPFWQEIFAHAGLRVSYVIACRNPANAARSLASRDGFDLEKGYFLWQEHMLLSLKYSEQAPRVCVDYDRVLQDPERQLQRMADVLGLALDPSSADLAVYKQDFLEQSLRHHGYNRDDLGLDPAAPHAVQILSKLLFALADDERPDDAQVRLEVEGLYGAMLDHYHGYRLMRRYDERSTELYWTLREKELALAERDQQIAHGTQSLALLNDALDEHKRQLEQGKALLSEYERRQQSNQEQLQQLKSTSTEQGARIGWLEADLARYESGRFLLKALARRMARRLGLPGMHSEQRLRRQMISNSGLFDAGYYRHTYADVAAAGVDPLEHYLGSGWQEGRDPSTAFSTRGYLRLHEDVRRQGGNPLVHYLRHGQKEGRPFQNAAGALIRLSPPRTRKQMLLEIRHILVRQPDLLLRFSGEVRRGGWRHALRLVSRRLQRAGGAAGRVSEARSRQEILLNDVYRVVPYYLNPYLDALPEASAGKVAVHLHFYYEDMAQQCIGYLANIPVTFDLYVSVPAGRDAAACERLFRQELPNVAQLYVESVPNRGRDIAPFIVQFGKRLGAYDYIGHFHTKKSPRSASLEGWLSALMETLCGSPSGVAQIFRLLDDDARIVYPAGNQVAAWDAAGWSDNLEIAGKLLRKHSDFDIDDFPFVEFPQGSMFWAKAACLEGLLGLPLRYEDFPEEPIGEDATLAHALERLITVFTTPHAGRNYRLEAPGLSNEPREYYEAQCDYSGAIVHDSIKVLAYYLPQFHPTPENDEWHGKGFTEWYKVRAANPLFQGHFQQHVPHEDVGYYHLDSPEQLGRQAEQMRQAGVHGMIFYHYWFSGKLILEKPAQMLLANPQIDMPFCFCWANENWTRRWDGNEQEILLGQVYSQEDARGFIQYLLPFFKDERYIKVDGRPLLFVYRPSSMEHCDDYLAIWREECERNGVPAPYVVATLTRGATSPRDYGMDAAVERVLHDWTGGAVADIRGDLQAYWPLNGSVLDYDAVAEHYMHKPLDNDYPLFRSLVPTWDNTARYGSQAYVLHDFTTEKMQAWMEQLIRYSEQHLPADRRFVVVNAWNEWAEGAHLEPDTRFGYGYLNAIGRALCDQPFAATRHIGIDPGLVLRLSIDADVRQQLQDDAEARRKFLRCLANSSVFARCRVSLDDRELADELRALGARCLDLDGRAADFDLLFRELYLFPATSIEQLLQMALRHRGFHVSASVLNDPAFVHGRALRNFEIGYWQRSGMELRPAGEFLGYKVCCRAACFRVPAQTSEPRRQSVEGKVSTVIRFHRRGDRVLLENAIFSLLTQGGCRVQPCLALQDMSEEEVAQLQAGLAVLPWAEDCQPLLRRYASSADNPDLRSLMLNDALKAVGSGYAAFLDYDDILFPHAYQTLLGRLKASGKNASFARVYSTTVEAASGLIVKRDKVYDYGHTHDEFLVRNHAPLHSFMLDLERIDLNAISYYDDMKYMEDYYLTLQLFTPGDTDWASLKAAEYIGDYIHREGDASNTLALGDQAEREALFRSEHYQLCEARICELRSHLGG